MSDFFFCKQKTAYELRISDWSSDVCSSDLNDLNVIDRFMQAFITYIDAGFGLLGGDVRFLTVTLIGIDITLAGLFWALGGDRSEEHTSELQSLMRSSYAVFCLKKKNTYTTSYRNCEKSTHKSVHGIKNAH